MSVINDMLASLDARRAAVPAGTAPVAAPRQATNPRRLQVIVLLGAAAVSAAAFGDWPALVQGTPKAPQPVAAAAAVAPPTPATVATPVSVAAATPLAPPAAGDTPPATQQAPAPARPVRVAMAVPSLARPVPPPAATSSAETGSGTAEKKSIAPTASQRAALAYRQATELGASGHSSQAIDRALDALAADPDHLGARQLAAILMFESQRLDEAGALLQAGLVRAPQQPRLAYLLARLKAESGDAAGALALLSGSPAQSAEAQGLRAAILARQGRFAEALPAYEAALRQDPGNASWWLGLGVALDADGQGALARQALQRARAIGTLRPDVVAYIDQKLASLE
jgi:MSHA biogenesis protein MshN